MSAGIKVRIEVKADDVLTDVFESNFASRCFNDAFIGLLEDMCDRDLVFVGDSLLSLDGIESLIQSLQMIVDDVEEME